MNSIQVTNIDKKRSAEEAVIGDHAKTEKKAKKQVQAKKEDVTIEERLRYMEKELFGDKSVMCAGVAGYGGSINWRSWESLLPACDADVPRFFEHLLDVHISRHYGSYELQLLVHALRFGLLQGYGDRYRQLRQAINDRMKVGKMKQRPEVQQWVAYMLQQETPLVFVYEVEKLDGTMMRYQRLPYHHFYRETKNDVHLLMEAKKSKKDVDSFFEELSE